MSNDTREPIERVQELFDFLRGQIPEGFKISRSHVPKLTDDQAWTVVWYIQNLYWKVPDHIERCCVCGDLFDTWSEGDCLDYGNAPYSFCESCRNREEFSKKMKRNPDKQARKEYIEG